LKGTYDESVSSFAFNFNLRRYNQESGYAKDEHPRCNMGVTRRTRVKTKIEAFSGTCVVGRCRLTV